MITKTGPAPGAVDYDCLVIGAGVAGLYQLHRLRELGLRVAAVDANADVGGTWFKNRYPGCRFDSESFTYGYFWSPELLQEWSWRERFAPREETLAYLGHVTEKFDLRRNIKFETRVVAAAWDEGRAAWSVEFATGEVVATRFLVTAMGMLSVPTSPKLPGLAEFAGIALHTFDWPDDLDLAGKRVAVVGTGSTGVQVISTVADAVEHLTVLQLDASWCVPLHNAPISPDQMDAIRANYDDIVRRCRESPTGFTHRADRMRSTEVSRAERLARWEELYSRPGFGLWLGNYRDTLTDEAANRELSEFVAAKIRERVDDPAVAELLIPTDHGFGTKRVPLETGYYEVYNQPNVELVDLRATPIRRITERGLLLAGRDGEGDREIEVDVLVFATGFDAVTGAFDRIEIRGVDGVTLREKWRHGPETYLGVATAGFPNLLMVGGPQSGSVAANFPRGIEDVVDWTTDLLATAYDRRVHRLEPERAAELDWVRHVTEFNAGLLMSRSRSWFNGHNVNLDREALTRPLIYTGGAVRYRRRLAEEVAGDYAGFCAVGEREAAPRSRAG